jgi:hypothetical protein
MISKKIITFTHIFGPHHGKPLMVSDLPSICPTLPDGGCVLTVALVGMADDRFGSMFLNGIQVCCVSGSSCNVHPNTTPIEESFYRCMNCALEFHLHHMLRMSFW